MCGGQKIICRSQLSPSTTEFLRIKLMLSGLMVGAFLPLICWPQNVLYCCHHHPPHLKKKKAVSLLCSLGTHYADKLASNSEVLLPLSPSARIKSLCHHAHAQNFNAKHCSLEKPGYVVNFTAQCSWVP